MSTEKFSVVSGPAAPLMIDNVDTDAIIPAPWVLSFGSRFSEGLFGRWRYTGGERGNPENPEFILNRPAYRQAKFLIAGENFGCGSSREHAVWALRGFGIRSVIAKGFGDIFYSNCFKNCFLPLALPADEVDRLAATAESVAGERPMSIDLERCTLTTPDDRILHFELDATHRRALLDGLEFIDQTLLHAAEIELFERRDRLSRPWIHALPPPPKARDMP
jgi:3-isopropylmalate/(R)-2-methylmalate dehydratase small subunit